MHVLAQLCVHDLAPLLWTDRAWRADALEEARARLWPRLCAQLPMVSVPEGAVRDRVLVRYACFLHAPVGDGRPRRYVCAACLRPCREVGVCQICGAPIARPPPRRGGARRFPLRRVLLGPALAVVLVAGALVAHRHARA